jgi:hydrogenase nickel incorporation protein HypA/HybF
MLEVALEAARDAGADRILEIHLVIGDLTTMVDDSVQFYFDLMAEGTAAEGATLVFRREAGHLSCAGCGLEARVSPPLPHLCPRCDGLALRVTGGQAFMVESIEVEDPGDADGDGPPPSEARTTPGPDPRPESRGVPA